MFEMTDVHLCENILEVLKPSRLAKNFLIFCIHPDCESKIVAFLTCSPKRCLIYNLNLDLLLILTCTQVCNDGPSSRAIQGVGLRPLAC